MTLPLGPPRYASVWIRASSCVSTFACAMACPLASLKHEPRLAFYAAIEIVSDWLSASTRRSLLSHRTNKGSRFNATL